MSSTDRDMLLNSWQYIASPEFSSYARWGRISPTSNELWDSDGQPATLIIVGQVVMDKSALQPLGSFQSQEEKQQRYQDSDGKRDSNCLNFKLVLVLRRPSNHVWKPDYDTAVLRLDALQEEVAKASAPRQYLLDKDQDPPSVRLTFPLWEKKKYTKSRNKYMTDSLEEDDVMRTLREDDDQKSKVTAEYRSYLPDNCLDSFATTAKTHHICLAPFFFTDGRRVPVDELSIRLENVVVEIMFSLKHFYYGPPAAGSSKYKTSKEGNSFSTAIEQVKILQINTIIPSPGAEPTMKSVQQTPSSQKGKGKCSALLPPAEASPSPRKKDKIDTSASTSTIEDDEVVKQVVSESM